jgi:hypothetical protein
MYEELPINSKYESKYKFSAIPSLLLSGMRFVALYFIVLVFWCLSARVLECFDPLLPKILPYLLYVVDGSAPVRLATRDKQVALADELRRGFLLLESRILNDPWSPLV